MSSIRHTMDILSRRSEIERRLGKHDSTTQMFMYYETVYGQWLLMRYNTLDVKDMEPMWF